MIPTVIQLDGIQVSSIVEGQDYLVPCVFGIPVVCPSHIDEGTEGPTKRHWHTDDRFGDIGRNFEYWSTSTRKELRMYVGDAIKTDIIRDDGQPITMEQKTSQKTVIRPSGGAFTSQVWLYHNLGHQNAKDGHCVHHSTPLVRQDGCSVCPAHGLQYNSDGTPRYKAPFFISLRYVDWRNDIHRIRKPVCTGNSGIEFCVNGNFDLFPLFMLEDADGNGILEYRSKHSVTLASEGGISTLSFTIGAWPKSGKCPSLVQTDPHTED